MNKRTPHNLIVGLIATIALFASLTPTISFAQTATENCIEKTCGGDSKCAAVLCHAIAPLEGGVNLVKDVGEGAADVATGAQRCIADPLECLSGLTSGSDGDTISFTEFEGELEPPPAEEFAEGLVQQTTLRDFILATTNFILGFLGIAAVVVIIYGGFLYVTAAGREEQATKGKKSVMYAVIGILLILGSFAIVNTLIFAPSDTESPGGGTTRGSAEDQSASFRGLFNVASADVQQAGEEFVEAYQYYKSVEQNLISLSSFREIGSSADLSTLLSSMTTILRTIELNAPPLASIYQPIQDLRAKIVEVANDSQARILQFNGDEDRWLTEYWQNSQTEFLNDLTTLNFQLYTANIHDFAYVVVTISETLANIREQIGEEIALLPAINSAFEDVIDGELNLIATGSTSEPSNILLRKADLSNQDVLRITQKMANLYNVLLNVIFVRAVISSDVTEGGAPLTVNFDALESVDPNDQTLNSFEWDFGDGSAPERCTDGSCVTTSHTYDRPGTYVVRLTIVSPSPNTVANGYAVARITVREPVIKINLKAEVGPSGDKQIYDLRKYDPDTGNLISDVSLLKVSPTEGEQGIVFDASETVPPGLTDLGQIGTEIRSIRWNFGNNEPEVILTDAIQLEQTAFYKAPGTYNMFVEIIDTQNNTDRKNVAVLVGSPLARINATPTGKLFVNDEFTLDGGNSTSDSGQISEWRWSDWTNPDSVEIDGPTDEEILRGKFTKPGTYTVTLYVEDNLGDSDTTTYTYVVESAPPVAQFTYLIPDPKQPSTVHFNGGLSYDPDGDDNITYSWEVNRDAGYEFVGGTSKTSQQPQIKFLQKGDYEVSLYVSDPDGFGPDSPQDSQPIQQTITIDNNLDVAWSDTVTAAMLQVDEDTEQTTAEITFNIVSDNAVAYDIDFGDGEKESSAMSNTASITHSYSQTGIYTATVAVFDIDDEDNSISRKVFIGSADAPLAIASIQVNGREIIDTTEEIEIFRNDTITFEAASSLNVDGTGRLLNYSWDFGDGERSTQRNVNHVYREIGTYETSLRVTNANDPSQISQEDTVTFNVVGSPPLLRNIVAVPVDSDLETPVTVRLTAVGAEDPDGQVTRYRWWYYDPNNDTDQLGVTVTQSPSALINIGTRGVTGEQQTYNFAVEITDDENNTVSSRDLITDEQNIPSLQVTNGPNDAPIASFSVDRTSVLVGDTVNFISSSTDPDGQITEYFWDFEGDGFANNTESLGPNVSYVYEKPVPNGVRVRLKVRDNNDSESVSDGIFIYVEGETEPPVAAFTLEQIDGTDQVEFTNNSRADEAGGLSIASNMWDFDTSRIDTDGDGNTGNDIDSTEENPTTPAGFYEEVGTLYRPRLTVTDSSGQTSFVTNSVILKSASGEPTEQLDARLLTRPTTSLTDGKVHLTGDSANVTFDYSSSTGDIETYIIDKNIFFDTNGNGRTDDDQDHVSTDAGEWTTDFHRDFGNIRARLTVIDSAGRRDTVDRDVVFDAPIGSTNIFANSANEAAGMLVTVTGFVILFLMVRRFTQTSNG